jgi:hypothetical protein
MYCFCKSAPKLKKQHSSPFVLQKSPFFFFLDPSILTRCARRGGRRPSAAQLVSSPPRTSTRSEPTPRSGEPVQGRMGRFFDLKFLHLGGWDGGFFISGRLVMPPARLGKISPKRSPVPLDSTELLQVDRRRGRRSPQHRPGRPPRETS